MTESPGIIPVTAVTTAGFESMSIVPAVNDQVELSESVNWASENEPAPRVSAASAESSAMIPRRRFLRRSICARCSVIHAREVPLSTCGQAACIPPGP